MKGFIILVLSLFTVAAHAYPYPASQQQYRSIQDAANPDPLYQPGYKQSFCEEVANTASSIMSARQHGVPYREMTPILGKLDPEVRFVVSGLIDAAFHYKIEKSVMQQTVVINEFGDNMLDACLKNL